MISFVLFRKLWPFLSLLYMYSVKMKETKSGLDTSNQNFGKTSKIFYRKNKKKHCLCKGETLLDILGEFRLWLSVKWRATRQQI